MGVDVMATSKYLDIPQRGLHHELTGSFFMLCYVHCVGVPFSVLVSVSVCVTVGLCQFSRHRLRLRQFSVCRCQIEYGPYRN